MIAKFINVHAMPNLILAKLFGVHPHDVPPKNEIITPPYNEIALSEISEKSELIHGAIVKSINGSTPRYPKNLIVFNGIFNFIASVDSKLKL